MTKREVLTTLAFRQDQLLREMEAAAKTMTLSSSHVVGNAIAVGMIVSSRLREVAKRPEMEQPITFVEKV